MIKYAETTQAITVTVRPLYLDGRSDFFSRRFVFAYFIEVTNHSTATVQLLSRKWRIDHGNNRIDFVEGEGVVGQQPVIEPGETHAYNSFCILETLKGKMEGAYRMERENGEQFWVNVPVFELIANAN
ncbi:MAG: Co2+/Mg2+ efflux protein ApaG [Bacteroidetes Order II. Incertae sedis bacterium]|nr:Co2+/Mg2+ efflux protein ApaG [Bacteroidetes Order II. bacterium]